MKPTMQGNAKVNNPIESRQWMGKTLQALRFLVGIGLPLLLFFVILVIVFNVLLPTYLPTSIFEAPLLLLVMNTLFLSIIPFVVALIALRGYIGGGSANLLFFGCGTLAFSLACFVAGWLGAQTQANANLTIHNTGVLLASLFNLLAGVTLYLGKSARKDGEKQKKNTGIFAYLGILIFTASLSFAALRGYTPAFYVPGSGPTLLREVVLTAATIFFGVSCLLIVVFDRDRRSFFLSCYAVALALITVGLIALMTSKRANSPLSWLGRSAQFAAGIYFLAAVVAAVRAAWTNRWTVPDAIRDFLRPSEALYRDLVETATDAIIPISTSGEILLWNTAAEKMFGYNRMEALRLVPSDLIDPEDSKRMFQEIEAGTVSGKGSYVGKLREVNARRKSGEEFPAELSFSSRRLGGGSISTLIIRDITERKRAEEALHQANQKLQSTLDSITDGLLVLDRNWRYTYFSETGAKMIGMRLEDLIGGCVWELFPHAKDSKFYEGYHRAVQTGQPVHFEEFYPGPLNKWLECHCYPSEEGLAVYFHDITERKRAEEALRESEERYRLAIQASNDAIWDINLTADTVHWNETYTVSFGRPPETRNSWQWWIDHMHPEDRDRTAGGLRAAIDGEANTWVCEYRFLRADGTWADIYDRAYIARDKSGKAWRAVGAMQDLTERKRAEEELRKSENKYRIVADNTYDFEFWINPRGQFIYASPSSKVITGYKAEDFIKDPDLRRRVVHPDDQTILDCHIEDNEKKHKVSEIEYRIIHADGSIRWISHACQPVFSDNGEYLGVRGSNRDITKRKQAEEALQQRTLELQHLAETLEQRVKERTAELADISSQLVSAQENERRRISYDLHDNVWQALLAIRFEIEDLFSGQDDLAALQEKAKEVMATVLDTVGKIRSMQGDLWPYVLDDIGLLATVNWYCREFEKSHPGVTIERKDDVTEHEIPSSAKIVIYRILQETLSNVAKHSQASRVTLRLLKKEQRVEFTIEDNGIGFDPVETMIKKTPWGGLGLLNIKARTELSGGIFGVESVKGKGTTVRASWPAGSK